jgi:general secretion pathway protein A
MYTEHFGFKENPFNVTPDPRFIYLSESHHEALNHIYYGIRERKGFIAITGEVGLGKTTLCRTLLGKLDSHTKTAFIFNPDLSASQLIGSILSDLGIKPQGRTKKDQIDSLNTFLIEQLANGNNVVVILDEAQGLGRRQLEQIRLLSNLETAEQKLLQIVLVGQPELAKKLDHLSLRQLKQRIVVRHSIEPLAEHEVRQYVNHRLSVVGGEPSIFSDGAVGAIYQFSQGIPRLINIVCDRALLHAFSSEVQTVTKEIAGQAIDEVLGKKSVHTHKTTSEAVTA